MKAVEFLGRKAEFERRFRRSLVVAFAVAALGVLTAALVGLAGPARRWSSLPALLGNGLPFWIVGFSAVAPATVMGSYSRQLRRAGLTCPQCGAHLAWVRGEVALETTACPDCRQRVIEDGPKPDFEWEWLNPMQIGLFQPPRWNQRIPRPDLRARFRNYQRRLRGLAITLTGASVVYFTLLATTDRWLPRLAGDAQRAQTQLEGPWASPVPSSLRLLLVGLGVVIGPLFLAPWLVLQERHRILDHFRLLCPHCGVSLPRRAGLAVALGRCGSCGGSVDEDRPPPPRSPLLRTRRTPAD